eukprot:1260378-Amphidinium_carterae.1
MESNISWGLLLTARKWRIACSTRWQRVAPLVLQEPIQCSEGVPSLQRAEFLSLEGTSCDGINVVSLLAGTVCRTC